MRVLIAIFKQLVRARAVFYKPENPENLANKICILLEDDKLRLKLGKAARELVEKKI
ncbi:MAG: glycosyltransferase [Candidatus Heimdallarchaeota archaeon]